MGSSSRKQKPIGFKRKLVCLQNKRLPLSTNLVVEHDEGLRIRGAMALFEADTDPSETQTSSNSPKLKIKASKSTISICSQPRMSSPTPRPVKDEELVSSSEWASSEPTKSTFLKRHSLTKRKVQRNVQFPEDFRDVHFNLERDMSFDEKSEEFWPR
jgi:hypothetical protein